MGLVALVVFLAPLSSASSIVSFSAPYSSFTTTGSSSTYTSACGVAHMSGPAGFNNATGVFNVVARATLSTCSGYNEAEVYAYTYLVSPNFTPSRGGFAYASVDLSAAWSSHVSLVGGGTGVSNYSSAYVSAEVYAYLYDATSGTIVDTYTNYDAVISSLTVVGPGSATSASTSAPFTIYTEGPVHGGQSYYFGITFYAQVSVYSDSGASGSASLNLGGTNGITLTGISVV